MSPAAAAAGAGAGAGAATWLVLEPAWLWGLLLLPLLFWLRERATAGHAPFRSFGAMLGRGLALAALLLAMARPAEERLVPDHAVLLAVDASASLDGARAEVARRWIEEARKLSRGEDLQLVIGGAATRVLDARAGTGRAADFDAALAEALSGTAPPERGTDLRSLLETALAALPEARRRDLVLFSDGGSTRGEPEPALRVAQTLDVQVHAVPLGEAPARLALARASGAQDRLAGDEVTVAATIRAEAPLSGRLVLHEGTAVRAEQAVDLPAGEHELALSFRPERAGLLDLAVSLEASGDTLHGDESIPLRIRVLPRPRALVVGAPGAAAALRDAVSQHQPALQIDEAPTLPDPPYDDWSAVVLLDPDLARLGAARAAALSAWVKGGGHLLVTGGPHGLVTDEPFLEDFAALLPVRFPRTKKEEQAPLAVVFLLDASDSMAGAHKFELAASAVAQTAHLLPERSKVGVVAFSDFPTWALPLSPFRGPEIVTAALAKVGVGGGTSIFPALQLAYEALRDDEALVKHAVLVSDGRSTTTFARYGDVVTAMARRQIGVSTIAVSGDAELAEMERIAAAGNGRPYRAERFSDLPRILLDEMVQVTRTNKIEERFEVQAVRGARMLRRLPPEPKFPALLGYVRGEQRPGSELALATDAGHPVLALGRAGRGTVVLFTSDVGGAWSRDWAAWDGRRALWDGVTDALLRADPPELLTFSAEVHGRDASLLFDALDTMRNPRGDLVVEAIVEAAGEAAWALDLPPVGPGRYGATLRLPSGRATLVRAAAIGTRGDPAGGSAAPGGELLLSLAPQPAEEWRWASTNEPLLRQIALGGGGEFAPEPSAIFGAAVDEKVVQEERWPWPLMAALVLLLLDLGWRRLPMPGRRAPSHARP